MRLIIDGFGKSISKKDNQIVIKENNKEINFFRIKDISQILIIGKGSITFDALNLLAENDIDCFSLNFNGNVNYRLSPPEKSNISLRKEQYFATNDIRGGILAKCFIKSKIKNQKAILGTLAKSRKNDEFLIHQRDKLNKYISKVDSIKNDNINNIRNNILGFEGQASHEYWKGFSHVVNEKWNFNLRSGKGAKDPINSLLNYGYAILQSEVWKSVYSVGLDPYCGFLHSERYGRVSLVFDMMEEFRQQIVDKTVLSIINKNMISINDFKFDEGNIILGGNSKKILISKIYDKLTSKIKFNEKSLSYENIILFQSKLLANYLIGQEKEYIGFYRRW